MLPNRLHSCETLLKEYYKRRKNTPRCDIDPYYNLLEAEEQTKLKEMKLKKLRREQSTKMECRKNQESIKLCEKVTAKIQSNRRFYRQSKR